MGAEAIRVLAPAKINLYLGVHDEKDARGYHRVDSVMAALELCDELWVKASDRLELTCEPNLGLPSERNLAWRAAERLGETLGNQPQVNIRMRKHIPSQAGLGGGSSDAAAVLRVLCEMWGVPVADVRVQEVARSLGADVPFFLDPVPTLLVGAGDVPHERFARSWDVPVVLVQAPNTGVSTAEAYAEFDREPPALPGLERVLRVLRDGQASALAEVVANNLAPVAERLQPQVGEVRRWLEAQAGVCVALVSGSGGCVFGLCDASADAARAAEAASGLGWWSCATRMV